MGGVFDMMKRHQWTADSIAKLRKLYPDTTAAQTSRAIGCSITGVYNKAHQLGIKKSAAFFASDMSARIQRGHTDPRIKATQIKPGTKPWNTGIKGRTGTHEACRATQFKPGGMPPNTQPVGSLRIICSKTGIRQLERKIGTEPGVSHKRWKPVHRLVWETAHGPVPKGCIVVFKPGMKTLVEAEITLDKVDCITRAENARRNDPGNRNPEIKRLYQVKGAITRQVNRINREHRESQST